MPGNENINRIWRKVSGILIGLYGIALAALTVFSFLWDNKGAKSVWDKSVIDWLFVIWLLIATTLVFYCAAYCYTKKGNSRFPLFIVGVIFLAHLLFVLVEAQGDALSYLGIPHVFIGLGFMMWLGVTSYEKKQEP
jgi:hypothetical protein